MNGPHKSSWRNVMNQGNVQFQECQRVVGGTIPTDNTSNKHHGTEPNSASEYLKVLLSVLSDETSESASVCRRHPSNGIDDDSVGISTKPRFLFFITTCYLLRYYLWFSSLLLCSCSRFKRNLLKTSTMDARDLDSFLMVGTKGYYPRSPLGKDDVFCGSTALHYTITVWDECDENNNISAGYTVTSDITRSCCAAIFFLRFWQFS